MFLTQNPRKPNDFDSFPTSQLFLLALIRVSEPIALTSIFPYAWKLVLYYNVGTEKDAAFYAGILIASFSLAEAISGFFWGCLSDRIGRKTVLLIGTAGTLLSLLILGFAESFWVALAGRVLGGLLNGNIAVIQTMVGELVKNPKHEPRAFAVMPFVWSIGTIIGPCIGGYFANPTKNFPALFDADGMFARFPYLLPNLICAALLLLSIVFAYVFLFETHPDMQPWSTYDDFKYTTANTPLLATAGSMSSAPANLSQESYGTFDRVSIQDSSPNKNTERKSFSRSSSSSSLAKNKAFTTPVVMLIIALGIYTYHSMTYDHLMPIFFQDKHRIHGLHFLDNGSLFPKVAGGLGLTTKQVGIIMSVNGIIALFVQGLIFPLMASFFGVWRLFVIVAIGHPIAYFIMPYLILLPQEWVSFGIYGALFLRNFFSILQYPLLLILIKEAAPSPSCLGKINGLAASTGGACRTLASPIAGALYDMGSQMRFVPLAWWASALVAVIGALQIPWIDKVKNKTAIVSTAVAWTQVEVPEERESRSQETAHIAERGVAEDV